MSIVKKKMERIIKEFGMYVNSCHQKRKAPNLCHLTRITRHLNYGIFFPPDVNIPFRLLLNLTKSYAKKCVCAWYAIITQTREGMESAEQFHFPDFVDSFLSILKNGFQVQAGPLGMIDIYSRDDFLNMLPNTDEEEKKKGEDSSRYKRKHNAAMKKNIRFCLINAVARDGIYPSSLDPHRYNFEELDESYFVDISTCRSKKKSKKQIALQENNRQLLLEGREAASQREQQRLENHPAEDTLKRKIKREENMGRESKQMLPKRIKLEA